MVIDLILDRKQGKPYNTRQFYYDCNSYLSVFFNIVEPIATALDSGTEADVKRELCKYIDEQEYNPEIKDWINSVEWLLT